MRSIARVCAWLVPFMAVFYVLGCSVLLVHHVERLPETIRRILTSAFSGPAPGRVVDEATGLVLPTR